MTIWLKAEIKTKARQNVLPVNDSRSVPHKSHVSWSTCQRKTARESRWQPQFGISAAFQPSLHRESGEALRLITFTEPHITSRNTADEPRTHTRTKRPAAALSEIKNASKCKMTNSLAVFILFKSVWSSQSKQTNKYSKAEDDGPDLHIYKLNFHANNCNYGNIIQGRMNILNIFNIYSILN